MGKYGLLGIFFIAHLLTPVIFANSVQARHTKAWRIGFKVGKHDGIVDGIWDGLGGCDSAKGITGSTQTKACLDGYNTGFNLVCKLGNFKCNA